MYDNYEPDYSNYEPEPPERFHDSVGMPSVPIDPMILAKEVIGQLQSYGLTVPTESTQMFQDLCRGFNQCIYMNHNNETAQTYVYSPKTGSAKSVTAKMYVSMLKKEASLIVVSTVVDAVDFCEDINSWCRDNTYARCYYSSEDTIENNTYKVEKKDLYNYRCIVITHNMFIREISN